MMAIIKFDPFLPGFYTIMDVDNLCNCRCTIISKTPEDTRLLGVRLGSVLFSGAVIGLVGELGVGKTCFVKGLAYGVNATPFDEVSSPTFAILHEYEGKTSLYHFDAYRIADSRELVTIGFDEYIAAEGVVVIEWADRIIHTLPDRRLMVHIAIINCSERRITFVAYGKEYEIVVQKLRDGVGHLLL